MTGRKPRARTARREEERDRERLARDRERLALLEPGGAADRPIEVASSSQVDVRAGDVRCTACGSPVRVEEHTARVHLGRALRVAHVKCTSCGKRRDVFFRLVGTSPN